MASPKQRWRRAAIRAVVAELGADADFDGLSEREIAFILNIPKSSVNRQLNTLRDGGIIESCPGERRSVRLARNREAGQHPESGFHDA